MGNGVMAIGPQLPRPFSTLPRAKLKGGEPSSALPRQFRRSIRLARLLSGGDTDAPKHSETGDSRSAIQNQGWLVDSVRCTYPGDYGTTGQGAHSEHPSAVRLKELATRTFREK